MQYTLFRYVKFIKKFHLQNDGNFSRDVLEFRLISAITFNSKEPIAIAVLRHSGQGTGNKHDLSEVYMVVI